MEEVESVLDVLAAHGFVALDVPVNETGRFVRIALWQAPARPAGHAASAAQDVEVDVSLHDMDGSRVALLPSTDDDELETLLLCRDAGRALAQLRGARISAPLLC